MSRLVALGALLLLLLAGASVAADGSTRTVTMPGKLYEPAHLEVLVGTTVTWRNDDSTNHTVTAADDTFASGYIPPGGSFTFRFDRQGRYAFTCTIHRLMRGSVDVYGIVLAGPDGPVSAGRRVVFAGLVPPGTTSVALRGPTGEQSVRPRPDGSFALRLAIGQPGRFRAVAGSLSSPVVRVLVRPLVRLRRVGRTVRVTSVPARPGARVVLQRYVRELFAWRAIGRARLDRSSRARLLVPAGAERVRVVVRGDDGWADAASPAVRIGG